MQLGTLCYIRNGNSILMLHRTKKVNDDMAGYWIGLGGHIDTLHGESPHECVVREVREESGLVIQPTLRAIVTFRNVEKETDDWYAYIFTAETSSTTVTECSEGELAWIPYNSLKDLKLIDGDRLLITWLYEQDKFISAKFIYNQKQLVDHTVIFS